MTRGWGPPVPSPLRMTRTRANWPTCSASTCGGRGRPVYEWRFARFAPLGKGMGKSRRGQLTWILCRMALAILLATSRGGGGTAHHPLPVRLRLQWRAVPRVNVVAHQQAGLLRGRSRQHLCSPRQRSRWDVLLFSPVQSYAAGSCNFSPTPKGLTFSEN